MYPQETRVVKLPGSIFQSASQGNQTFGMNDSPVPEYLGEADLVKRDPQFLTAGKGKKRIWRWQTEADRT